MRFPLSEGPERAEETRVHDELRLGEVSEGRRPGSDGPQVPDREEEAEEVHAAEQHKGEEDS